MLGEYLQNKNKVKTVHHIPEVVEEKEQLVEEQEEMIAPTHEVTEEHQSDSETWHIVTGADAKDLDLDLAEKSASLARR